MQSPSHSLTAHTRAVQDTTTPPSAGRTNKPELSKALTHQVLASEQNQSCPRHYHTFKCWHQNKHARAVQDTTTPSAGIRTNMPELSKTLPHQVLASEQTCQNCPRHYHTKCWHQNKQVRAAQDTTTPSAGIRTNMPELSKTLPHQVLASEQTCQSCPRHYHTKCRHQNKHARTVQDTTTPPNAGIRTNKPELS
ncbi:hypothetical protein BsWGS_11396 [Bradybaena similaris]